MFDRFQGTAYFRGEFTPSSEVSISVMDFGFTMGVTVTERLRTYGLQATLLEMHLSRFKRGLEIVGIEIGPEQDLAQLVNEVIARNRSQVDSRDDLELNIFCTPGEPQDEPQGEPQDEPHQATLGIMAWPARFYRWAQKYSVGEQLAIVATRETSKQNWPKELKCRSRMHYWLAEREAEKLVPRSKPLLLDLDGNVGESSSGLVAARVADQIIAPPEDAILPSISFAVAREFLTQLDLAVIRRPLSIDELLAADELLMFSTPYFALPVTRVDQTTIADGTAGAVFKALLEKFSSSVGVDLIAQANRFSNRTG